MNSAVDEDAELRALVNAGRRKSLELKMAGALEDALLRQERTLAALAARKRPRAKETEPEPEPWVAEPDTEPEPDVETEAAWSFCAAEKESSSSPPGLPAGFVRVEAEEPRVVPAAPPPRPPTPLTGVSVGLSGRLVSAVRCITRQMQRKILADMHIAGPDDVRRICNFAQRSPEWMAARMHRMTGSKCGSAAAMNPYESPDKLLCELLWPTFFGNKACENGTKMEPFAAASVLRIMRLTDTGAQLAIPGLIVSQTEPIFAYSADGVLLFSDGTRKLIEIKTPVRRKPYPCVPPMYMCQMQLGMHLLDLPSCLFVVYCGRGQTGVDTDTHITEIPRDEPFIQGTLLPRLRAFFFRRYLPLRVCFDLGMLRQNQCHVPHGVTVEYLESSVY